MRPQRVNIVEGQNMNFSSTYGIYKQETGIILSLTKLSSNKESKYITTGTYIWTNGLPPQISEYKFKK